MSNALAADKELRKTWSAFGELMGTLGVMEVVVDQTEEPTVKEGWSERLRAYQAWCEREIEELMQFGDHFDKG